MGSNSHQLGMKINQPLLKKGRMNRILLYIGAFNPPHRGHMLVLHHGYRDCGDDFNVVAAIVLLKDDKYLGIKNRYASRNLLCQFWPLLRSGGHDADLWQQSIPKSATLSGVRTYSSQTGRGHCRRTTLTFRKRTTPVFLSGKKFPNLQKQTVSMSNLSGCLDQTISQFGSKSKLHSHLDSSLAELIAATNGTSLGATVTTQRSSARPQGQWKNTITSVVLANSTTSLCGYPSPLRRRHRETQRSHLPGYTRTKKKKISPRLHLKRTGPVSGNAICSKTRKSTPASCTSPPQHPTARAEK